MDHVPPQPSHDELLDIWQQSLLDVLALAETLTPEQWQAQTWLPGWTVSDVVAHVIDLEQLFGGEARPDHTPDWDALPHVKDEFSKVVEIGVDSRRGRSPEELVTELRETIERRGPQVRALAPDAEVFGPTGGLMPIDRFLRTRTYDTWVHEQDIRGAIGSDAGWNSAPAAIAYQQMTRAVPYMWGKGVKAPVGKTLLLVIVGPGLQHDELVTIDENGRGVPAPEGTRPDVTAEMTWAAFMRLASGRVAPDDPWLANKMEITGDAELKERLLPGMNIAP